VGAMVVRLLLIVRVSLLMNGGLDPVALDMQGRVGDRYEANSCETSFEDLVYNRSQ